MLNCVLMVRSSINIMLQQLLLSRLNPNSLPVICSFVLFCFDFFFHMYIASLPGLRISVLTSYFVITRIRPAFGVETIQIPYDLCNGERDTYQSRYYSILQVIDKLAIPPPPPLSKEKFNGS